jgi:hypothetical protein
MKWVLLAVAIATAGCATHVVGPPGTTVEQARHVDMLCEYEAMKATAPMGMFGGTSAMIREAYQQVKIANTCLALMGYQRKRGDYTQ